MSIQPTGILPYLRDCSLESLADLRLARQNQAANLRKQTVALIHEWIEAQAEARAAEIVAEFGEALICDVAPARGPDLSCAAIAPPHE